MKSKILLCGIFMFCMGSSDLMYAGGYYHHHHRHHHRKHRHHFYPPYFRAVRPYRPAPQYYTPNPYREGRLHCHGSMC